MWGKVSFHRSRKPSAASVSNTKTDKALPSIPPNHANTPSPPLRPVPERRVTSSIYSHDITVESPRQRSFSVNHQLPPAPKTVGYQTYGSGSTGRDVSPPDSPDFIGHGPGMDNGRVSPMEHDPNPNGGQGGNNFNSNLPVLRRRAHTSNADVTAPGRPSPNPSARAHDTRWDAFSGEPTTSDAGRPGQVDPRDMTNQLGSKPSGSGILGWGKEHLQAKRRLTETRSKMGREPWKGASGRSPIVNPIQEKPLGRSASSRVRPSRSNDRMRDRSTPSPGPDFGYLGMVPTVVTTITGGEANTAAAGKHLPSRDLQRTRVSEEEPTPTSVHHSRTPPRVDLPAPEPDLTITLAALKLTNDANAGEPTSRFSATTYEPTEGGTSTATASLRNSIDAASLSTENFAASVMSRKRPVPSIHTPGMKPTRKPTPSQISDDGASTRAPSVCPPEQPVENRVELLEARQSTLGRRKANIDTIIHELTQVIQPSSIDYDMAAREEVKKTVASLNAELAEIKREEHEIGLKLLRLWKKRDEQDFYGGGTSLWVKRVTS
ncbi:hypothetical protein P168DRAFT_10274 [Aspergillus campestris IBT 28561]|uniref:BHLH domain-containing protein n=1 Tax=Aspergillus campestris (strain IBT 28561) TaxID=1392248 RepID=A0A2I1DE55_ASPC2|nr:uncharacterized protein P168DRAFT_10274 [Aspergillus campestris IBT 28561]PKY08169.1 hypothetical protein P168DRAFT_10274 [Aspergillus campestris IBT 28561]